MTDVLLTEAERRQIEEIIERGKKRAAAPKPKPFADMFDLILNAEKYKADAARWQELVRIYGEKEDLLELVADAEKWRSLPKGLSGQPISKEEHAAALRCIAVDVETRQDAEKHRAHVKAFGEDYVALRREYCEDLHEMTKDVVMGSDYIELVQDAKKWKQVEQVFGFTTFEKTKVCWEEIEKDAALGALVRKLPSDYSLTHTLDGEWRVNTVHLKIQPDHATPEDALQAAFAEEKR